MKMKPILLSLVMLSVGGLCVAKAQDKTPEAGKPKLVLDSFTHDFGTVESGTPLTFTFKVKNEGNADLTIMSVAPS